MGRQDLIDVKKKAEFDYNCKLICNEKTIFPAMRNLVEERGMGKREAARYIHKDSGGMVSEERARKVYYDRSNNKNTCGASVPLKKKSTTTTTPKTTVPKEKEEVTTVCNPSTEKLTVVKPGELKLKPMGHELSTVTSTGKVPERFGKGGRVPPKSGLIMSDETIERLIEKVNIWHGSLYGKKDLLGTIKSSVLKKKLMGELIQLNDIVKEIMDLLDLLVGENSLTHQEK